MKLQRLIETPYFVEELTAMQCDMLLLVSHPDDDAIFAAELQRRLGMFTWVVVCVTHTRESPRGREMMAWQRALGTDPARVHFLGAPDDPEDRRQSRCSLDRDALAAGLGALAIEPRLVVSHGARGEYGHPHHLFVHALARRVFAGAPQLYFASAGEAADVTLACLEKTERILRYYPSQAANVRQFVKTEERFVWGPPSPRSSG